MAHDIYDLIARRATCRAYRPDPIPEQVLGRVTGTLPDAGWFILWLHGY